MSTLPRRGLIELGVLTFFWGVNWPIMKIGVNEMPPMSFRALSMAFGLPVAFAFLTINIVGALFFLGGEPDIVGRWAWLKPAHAWLDKLFGEKK